MSDHYLTIAVPVDTFPDWILQIAAAHDVPPGAVLWSKRWGMPMSLSDTRKPGAEPFWSQAPDDSWNPIEWDYR